MGEFEADESGSPGHRGEPLGVKQNPRGLFGAAGRCSVAQHLGRKQAILIEEVIDR